MARVAWIAIALGALGTKAEAPREAPPGPVLIVRVEGAPEVERSRSDDDIAAALLLPSLPSEARAQLVEQMDHAASRLEGRASPIVEDFGDDEVEPVSELRRETAGIVPSLSAARALSVSQWEMPGSTVRVAAGCVEGRAAPGEICAPLWGRDATDREQPKELARARLLAWAVSQSVVVELGSAASSETVAHALRARIGRTSLVALVLTRDELVLRPVPDREELRAAAVRLGRAMAANHIQDEHHLDGIARSAPSGRALPWLSLMPSQLLVVPRLSAFGRSREVEAEIARATDIARSR